jgi:hypothetical protein
MLVNLTSIIYSCGMPTQPARERRSSSDVARDRAAIRDVLPGFLVLLVLQGSLELADHHGALSLWYLIWSLSPLIPALWLVWAQLRSLRRADEYQRMVQLEALAIGFGAVIVVALAGGLLDAAGLGDPRQSLQITFTVGLFAWIGALGLMTLRTS